MNIKSKEILDVVIKSLQDSRGFIESSDKPHIFIEWIVNEAIGQYFIDKGKNKTEIAKFLGITDSYFQKKYMSRKVEIIAKGVNIARVKKGNKKAPLLALFNADQG